MKKALFNIIWVLFLGAGILSCKEDIPELGTPPTAEDLAFTVTPSETSANILTFSNTSGAFLKQWEFSNGQRFEGSSVQVTFPFQGTYDVTLRVFTSGGSLETTESFLVPETDLNLLESIYTILTGGNEAPEGKRWVVDAGTQGHMGIGPADGNTPAWWAAAPNDKSETGLYDDVYTFQLDGMKFIMETNGDVYVNNAQGPNFPGAYANKGDLTAPFDGPENLSWSVSKDGDKQFLTINGAGFIGYYTGVSTYEVLTATEELIHLRYLDAANSANAWYLRLVPEGFVSAPTTTTLPIDFEGAVPPFVGFGGSTYEVVDNPAADGVNGSAKVGKYVKGTEGSWAGISTQLSGKLDFSVNTVFKYKVYSPVTGRALFKIEDSADAGKFVEVFADVTQANQWQELTFDFSGTESGVYDKIALFLDFDNNAGGTFLIDDIRLEAVTASLTEAALTGGASKAWKLKPAAGSFGVGPNKGTDEWWPNGADISADRPCLFNDEYVFSTGGAYEYKANGDVWAEGYMGVAPDGCIDEADLPANAAAWGAGTHTFTFDEGTESTPATITVSGTGAFIALPKAYNGGEYASAPPTTDGSVTYEVLSYVKTATSETITISVDIAGGFWTFVLEAQ